MNVPEKVDSETTYSNQSGTPHPPSVTFVRPFLAVSSVLKRPCRPEQSTNLTPPPSPISKRDKHWRRQYRVGSLSLRGKVLGDPVQELVRSWRGRWVCGLCISLRPLPWRSSISEPKPVSEHTAIVPTPPKPPLRPPAFL
jgi:hypothetical protein